ncbi:hypothetical protein [Actinokineospora sp. NPDC004072]
MAAGPAAAEPASALSCYGSAKSFSKPSGVRWYPSGGGHFTTTSNCADINVKLNAGRWIAVCFKPSSRPEYCQSNYTWAAAGQWTVIATDVLDGTRFYFDFDSTAAVSGVWAA